MNLPHDEITNDVNTARWIYHSMQLPDEITEDEFTDTMKLPLHDEFTS